MRAWTSEQRGRRAVLLLPFCMFAAAGCANQTYLIEFSEWNGPPGKLVPALRERDRRAVNLVPRSFRPAGPAPALPGRAVGEILRVRGGVGAGRYWAAGGISTALGAILAGAGFGLGFIANSSVRAHSDRFAAGVALGSLGAALHVVIAPVMFGVAATRERTAGEHSATTFTKDEARDRHDPLVHLLP
jgi:hypothetical protein